MNSELEGANPHITHQEGVVSLIGQIDIFVTHHAQIFECVGVG